MSEISGNINAKNLQGTGYYVSKESRKEEVYATEPHIHEQNALTGLKTEVHKLSNDVLTYFPKGFAGSKNSDFYEYLSLGKVPYLIGSIMLIGLYSLANKRYNSASAAAAGNIAKRMGAGVVLYGIGKWLSKKAAHTGIKASTGVDLDMKYMNIVQELPENGQKAGFKRVQYPGVFDSADFPRKDLIAQKNELEYGNIYEWEDRIAKKAGFKNNRLNAPNQTIWPKVRELKVRTTALENVSQYIAAATGVALGSQKAFGKIGVHKPVNRKLNFKNALKSIKNMPSAIKNGISDIITFTKQEKEGYIPKEIIKPDVRAIKNATGIKEKAKAFAEQMSVARQARKGIIAGTGIGAFCRGVKRFAESHVTKGIIPNVFKTVKEAFKELWNGTDRNIITKHYGKALIIGTIASTALTWLIPTLGFKINPNTMKSKVNTKKEYEVC